MLNNISKQIDEMIDESLKKDYRYFRRDFDNILDHIDVKLSQKYTTKTVNDLLHLTSGRISARRTIIRKIQSLLTKSALSHASKMILWFLMSEYLEDLKNLKLDLEDYRHY